MGNSQSSQTVLNETLNKVSINVMQKNSTSLSGSVEQSNETTIAGNTGTVTLDGVIQVNSSSINVSALSDSAASNKLQADLIAQLKSSVEQAIPAISLNSNLKQDVSNKISNHVNSNVNVENLQNIAAQTKQNNTFKVLANNNVNTRDFVQKNEATLIMALVNKMNSEIVADIKASGALDNAASNKGSNILPDFGSMYMIVIIVIIIVICGGLYYLNTMEWEDIITKPIPLAVLAAMALSLFGGALYASSASGSKK
jgi:hypothetical protein